MNEAADAAARGWHVVATTASVQRPKTIVPVRLAAGALDEPLLLIRDAADRLTALSNVCTHRGHILVNEPQADAKAIQCPYHGRCFDLDGRVVRSPGFEDVAVDTLEPLPGVRVATWGPLVFAALDDAPAFDDWMAGPHARLGFLPSSAWVASERVVYDVEAHWTVYVENYLEGLHIPFVHPALARTVDWRTYRYELQTQGNLQIAYASRRNSQRAEPIFSLPPGHPDIGDAVSAYYFWLFPTTMLNIYPWGLSLNMVQPVGSDRCRVVFESFVGDSSVRGRGAGAGLDQVEREDEVVVTSVQQGIRSRLFRPGRLSSQHEVCVGHFRRLLAAKA